jgi:hypothetical protein
VDVPAFRLFIDLLAGEGGHGGIEALGAVAGKSQKNFAEAPSVLTVKRNSQPL